MYDNYLSYNHYYNSDSRKSGYYCIVKQQDKFGIINENGKQILPIIYDTIAYEISHNQVIAKLGKFGVVNLHNKTIIPFTYDNIFFSYSEDKLNQEYKVEINSKFGLINDKNLKILDAIYDGFDILDKGFRIAEKGNLYGLIDKFGKEIIPFNYNELNHFRNKERIKVCKNELCGVIDLQNNVIIPLEYSGIGLGEFDKNNEYSESKYIYEAYKNYEVRMIIDEKNNIIHKFPQN